MKKKNRIFYILLPLLFTGMAFFAYRSHQLGKELKDAHTLKDQLAQLKGKQLKMASIDSLLVQGRYEEALLSYQQTMEGQKEANVDISLRMALAQRLLDNARTLPPQTEEPMFKQDSTDNGAIAPTLVRTLDSLQFALEKSKVQIQSLQGQLLKSSVGGYLKFNSNKGTPLHYVGEIKNGKANGSGIALMDTGSRYEGSWENNERHGKGTFYWPDGQKYSGEYAHDMRNGNGTYYWPNGEKYVGGWKDDKRYGEGTFYGPDGTVVTQGIWKDDKLQDQGKKNKNP